MSETESKAGLKLDHVKKEDIIGKRLIECFPKAKEFAIFGALQKVYKTGESEYLSQKFYIDERISGWRENHVLKLSANHIVALYEDISENKIYEEKIIRSEAQLNNAVIMAHLGPWEYDVVNDMFTFNDAFYSMFRTNSREIGSYKMRSKDYAKRFLHPDDAPLVEEETRKAIETDDPNFSRQLEHRVIFADGEIGYISVRFFIIKDENGRTIRTYGVNQDITEQKNNEQRIKLQLKELKIFHDASVGRELKMVNLKKRLRSWKKSLTIRTILNF